MNEKDFRDLYIVRQKQIEVSEDLKDRVLRATEELERESSTTTVQPHTSTTKNATRNHLINRTTGKPSHLPWYLAAAACVLAVMLGFGLMPILNKASKPASITSTEFVVKAYAAETNTPLELGNENQIVFDRDTTIGFQTGDYSNAGYFTGCLFKVEGEGIVRIQASVSSGELYEFAYEEFTKGNNSDRWTEALNWKPTTRGSGTYYSGYDYVMPAWINDGLAKDDLNKLVQVRLSKRLGSTVDVVFNGDTSIGLWTNESIEGHQNPIDAVIDSFDGRILTITVQFEDGHYSTQVIELHAADLRAEIGTGIGNAQGLRILPEIIDADTISTDAPNDTLTIHSLFGVIVETNDQPFPNSLEDANSRMEIVDSPYVLP